MGSLLVFLTHQQGLDHFVLTLIPFSLILHAEKIGESIFLLAQTIARAAFLDG
jgi:hypothetical protein